MTEPNETPEPVPTLAAASVDPVDLYALPPEAIQEPPSSLWKAFRKIGPGIILAASIVGTGELIATTNMGAEAGFVLLWMVLLGCVIKIFVQLELGRHAIVHGQTTLAAFNRLPGPRIGASWICWAWLIMMLLTQAQIAAMQNLIGAAAHMAMPFLSSGAWSVVVTIIAILLLYSGGYHRLERVTTILVALATTFTVVWVIGLQWSDRPITSAQLASGLTFQLPAAALAVAFSAFGITGVGASELFAYPYWCIEKGYARATGKRSPDEAWAQRARGWMKVMRLDAWFSLVIYTIATVAFYLLGAAVLHPRYIELKQRKALQDEGLLKTLSEMFVAPLRGTSLEWLSTGTMIGFLIGASVVLFKTLYVATAGNSRLTADLLHLAGIAKIETQTQRDRIVRVFVIFYHCLALTLCLLFPKPILLVIIGGAAQAIMLPIIAGATIYLRVKYADPRVAPSKLSDLFLWISALSMAFIATYTLWAKVIAPMISGK